MGLTTEAEFGQFVKRLIQGAKKARFRDVVKASTGYELLQLDSDTESLLKQIKAKLSSDLRKLSKRVERDYNGRANELSNFLEPIVIDEIKSLKGFQIARPTSSDGKRRSSGYPDFFVVASKKCFYLELKIFQEKTRASSLRSFYYKPSEVNKITSSCPHILLGFEVESKRGDNSSPFIIKSLRLLDLYELFVDLKPEFNANNIEIYKCKQI